MLTLAVCAEHSPLPFHRPRTPHRPPAAIPSPFFAHALIIVRHGLLHATSPTSTVGLCTMRNVFFVILLILVSTGNAATYSVDKIRQQRPCLIPSGSDTSLTPPFWCSLSANVTITSSCTTKVTEYIRPPWTVSQMHRVLIKQSTQTIRDISVTQVLNNSRFKIPSLEKQSKDKLTVNIEFQPLVVTASSTIVLEYAMYNGILGWLYCSTDKVFQRHPTPSRNRIAIWRPGGLSVSRIDTISVQFYFPGARAKNIAQLRVHKPPLFNGTVAIQNRSVSSFTHRSGVVVTRPELLIYYLRFAAASGRLVCAQYRNCGEEVRASSMVPEKTSRGSKVELALAIVVIVFVALFGVGIIALCLRKRKKREADEDTAINPELPSGLHHFAYDTGDEVSSGKWKSGVLSELRPGEAPNSPTSRAESVFVRDISPPNRLHGRASL